MNVFEALRGALGQDMQAGLVRLCIKNDFILMLKWQLVNLCTLLNNGPHSTALPIY